ncbi:MAG: cytochrome P450 [Gemmatimonadaceae bacterium]
MKARLHDTMLNLAAHPIGWPLARLARRAGGVMNVPGFGLVVSDAAFAHDVLVRDGDFIKNAPHSISATITELLGPFALANMDGDAHRTLRGKLADVLSPAQARALLSACDAPLAELRGALAAGETVDLVRSMRIMSGRLTFDMLGVAPPPGREDEACVELVALGERIASGFDFRTPSPRRMADARTQVDQLVAYARTGYDSPDAPVTSFVRRLRELGLSFEEAKGVLSIVFLAGTLTTAAALPRIVALLADSGQLGRLSGHPEDIPAAIAEGLRFTTPVPATMRVAQKDVDVCGHRVAAGTRVVILTCNLARDARLFPDPDRFDAARVSDSRARHLWFGAGPHFCLGFVVAQLQLRQVIEALISVPGALRVVRRSVARGVIVPAYSRLEVRLHG